MAEPSQEQINTWVADLQEVRNERLELLPEGTELIHYIADAMNALEVAFLVIQGSAAPDNPTPQGAVFVPTSNPKDAKQL